ncbi:MAG: 4,5-DOPA dioxygenase extradiol [Ignavibacteriales bacterium]|nr:4,5-DOPA dioxygenase extradiol [Ignavibacteriales bacterium]
MNLNDIKNLNKTHNSTDKMPVLFVGHGSPMNAIEENEFSAGWRKAGESLPKPSMILCVSAHWETDGTFVTAVPKPETIHDFYGFPKELFAVQYPAPGNPGMAKEISDEIKSTDVGLDEKWGLDHGAWSVIKHMYPNADVPVVQFSIDRRKGPNYHYELAKELSFLRRKGVLIVGSGNMIHNLRVIAWNKMNESEYGYDWAHEADFKLKNIINGGDFKELVNYSKQGGEMEMAVPTPEHFIPLLYTLGLKEETDQLSWFNDKLVLGSISMASLLIG